MGYFRPAIEAMTGYVPGEQPPPGTPVIKLNTNENPYPPSPQAMAVLHSLDSEWLRRYPDPYGREVRQAVSQGLQVPEDWVIVTNGSDDLLNILIRACAEGHSRPVAYPTPTYVLYRTLAALQPAQVIEIPYPENYRLPLDELVAAQAAVTLIASPNSPSGHSVPVVDLGRLAQRLSGILAIDEAYVDFADTSALELVQQHANVLLLRTLSKGYGLAGLRLGFGLAQPELIAGLFKVKDSYTVDAVAMAVGAAALRDQAYKDQRAKQIKASRTRLIRELRRLGFTVPDSQGNFVLATVPMGSAQALTQALKQRGILVRYFNQPGLDDKLRITIGTEAQNQQLLEILQALLANAHSLN
ncbi:histidinol-phosphate transaminase [Halomicronema hongdechloris C2206]|uniref:Histidinol-phosphate aminotransferase n=1 Tax=Halomicronema hongdechloris C2206 TaxID=1641165 RepID=A0A1Z3HTJ8_9CYAN|nr:histidinol-phosphate transaminase [Halomicronema hongdechloris]ASC73586.1 histidinol-phosphate transaminase [Halomicronema hongdechloris C2206]